MQTPRSLFNGQPADSVGIFDRGLLYGDGLFETLAVRGGGVCLWSMHLERLLWGAERLGIPAPESGLLRAEVKRLLSDDALDGVLRITLTRGEGGRGYRGPSAPNPSRIMSWYPELPSAVGTRRQGISVRLCRWRLGDNPALAGIKHLNRLEQVLARSEWDDPAVVEGLMADACGNIICGTMTNVFLLGDDGLITPRIDRCGIAGTVRRLVFQEAEKLGMAVREQTLGPAALFRTPALFLTNSVLGPVAVASLDGHVYDPRSYPLALLEAVGDRTFKPELMT